MSLPADDLEELGAEHDLFPPTQGEAIPWAPGDAPHGENLDLNEYPRELLRLKQCRSFRADLRHKLTVIIRAHGGVGNRGVNNAAYALFTTRQTIGRWLRWDCAPAERVTWEKIDRLYAESIEKLVAEKTRKKNQRTRNAPRLRPNFVVAGGDPQGPPENVLLATADPKPE